MTWPEGGQRQNASFLSMPVLLITASFFLPVAAPSLLGWMNGFLAVPVLLLLVLSEDKKLAYRQVGNGLFLAAGGALLLKQVVLLFFGLTLLPLAYSLYQSFQQKEEPFVAGGKGVIVLGFSWLIFWGISGTIAGINPYTSLVSSLDESFARVLEIYRSNADLPPDVLLGLEQVVQEVRKLVPRVLPGLLAGSVIITVWLNMVVSYKLLRRLKPTEIIWPEYSQWQLPDKLVWLPIIAVILSLAGGEQVKNAGYILGIVSTIIYLFQGVSIFIYLLDKWKVPNLLRYVIYGIFAVQGYGILMLSVIGLADTWFDIRKLNQTEQINNSQNKE